MLTEEKLRWFSEQVYWIDKSKKDKPFTPKEGEKYYYDSKNPDMGQFKILKVEDNQKDGMQAMAVAPIRNGEVDTSEVVIAYAGTNSSDFKDLETDLRSVVDLYGKTDSPGDYYDINELRVAGQIESAQTFAAEVKREYGNAEITTTGHSLGEFLALYVAAENQWQNIGFNGPDPYALLSAAAKEWIKNNPGMLTNYRNRGDLLGNFGGNGTGAEIKVSMGMGLQNPLNYHELSAWKFDKEGNILISDNEFNQQALIQQAQRKIMLAFTNEMQGLKRLKSKLKASGGGLSANEKIYLDDQQALLVVNTARSEYQLAMSKIVKLCQEEIEKVQELWQTTLREARNQADLLTETEIKDSLAVGGASKKQMVHVPSDFFQEKIAETKAMDSQFAALAEEIKSSIATLLQKDQQLAQQIHT
jgi:hypothetical protein